MKTVHQGVRVTGHGPENWRTEVQDEPGGKWSITGPPYGTRVEALLHVAEAATVHFGMQPPLIPAMAEALAAVDKAQSNDLREGPEREMEALRMLAEAVRAAYIEQARRTP